MLEDEVALALGLMGHHAAVGAAAFLGEPTEMIDGHRHFSFALRKGFAILHRYHSGDGLEARRQFPGNGQQVIPSSEGGQVAPGGKSGGGVREGFSHARPADRRHFGKYFPGRGVFHLQPFRAVVPGTIEVKRVVFRHVNDPPMVGMLENPRKQNRR